MLFHTRNNIIAHVHLIFNRSGVNVLYFSDGKVRPGIRDTNNNTFYLKNVIYHS
jgi:hypothetical protein